MACPYCSTSIEKYGANPATMQWRVVRGDSSALRVYFYENDETTVLDNSTWTYLSTAFNPVTKETEVLTVTAGEGFVDITATPTVTVDWGSGYGSTVAEFPFDLQVTISENGIDTVWTPVIGTIAVMGDVTGGRL